jgi:hypothetical protein
MARSPEDDRGARDAHPSCRLTTKIPGVFTNTEWLARGPRRRTDRLQLDRTSEPDRRGQPNDVDVDQRRPHGWGELDPRLRLLDPIHRSLESQFLLYKDSVPTKQELHLYVTVA